MQNSKSEGTVEIDENLTSRQIAVLGLEAMKKMATSSVFVSGMSGLGIETAKSVALAGVKNLTLHDTVNASWLDMSTQFYITQEDMGKNRALISAPKIAELNVYTHIEVKTDDLNQVNFDVYFAEFNLICLIGSPLALQIKVNNWCRQNGKKFIVADSPGLFGYIFCDFGESFETTDPYGTVLKELIVADIRIISENELHIHCDQNQRHDLFDGALIKFSEVQGMTELNDNEFRVIGMDQYSFKIETDTKSLSPYSKGGLVLEQRGTKAYSFQSLEEQIQNPIFADQILDFCKCDQPQLLLALQALDQYRVTHSQYPLPWDTKSALELIEIAKNINSASKNPIEVDLELLTKISFTSRGDFVGNTAFLGGLLAQEILIGISYKFSPIVQWVFNDVREIVPSIDGFSLHDFEPRGTRGDAQRVVIGESNCTKLANSNLFMIGTGAIGCEMLKNYAMLGVSTSPNATISITDNDIIEKSNLNRQFLFRAKDIGKPKSTTAGEAVKLMNPDIRVSAKTTKVSEETVDSFPDSFFQSQDCIVNALDNIDARVYVDSRCVSNQKPLLESGTEGLKGHVQVIYPNLTVHFEKESDLGEESFPYCTVKHFPNRIVHCIQWAREKFRQLFEDIPSEVSQFLQDCQSIPQFWEKNFGPNSKKIEKNRMKKMISVCSIQPQSYSDCVKLARKKFASFYENSITQLFYNFPLDHVVDGRPFWSPPRRVPNIITFDSSNELHLDFIEHMAALYAHVYQIHVIETQRDVIQKIVNEVVLPEYVVKTNKKIVSDQKMNKDEAQKTETNVEWEEGEYQQFVDILRSKTENTNIKLIPEEFEKDHDENHHIDWITASSNLRGVQYNLKTATRIETKRIAGKIIPAMATSTSAVAGLVSVELVKILAGIHSIETFKNSWNINLAIPSLIKSEPAPVKGQKVSDNLTITCWTPRFEMNKGDITIGQLLRYFEKDYGLKITGITYKGTRFWNDYSKEGQDNKKFKIYNRFLSTFNLPSESFFADLILSFETLDNQEVLSPPEVRYYFKKPPTAASNNDMEIQ